MKTIWGVSLVFFFAMALIAREMPTLGAQPEVLFDYKKLKNSQEKLSLQVEFNKAVLLIDGGQYKQAIEILKQTAKIHKIPSFLNIGISYYKMGSDYNAKLYLDKIYQTQEIITTDIYSYLSACFYLFKITKQEVYLERLVKVSKKQKHLDENSLLLVIDTSIILKDYDLALNMLQKLANPDNFKLALLYLRKKDYEKTQLYLGRAYQNTPDQKILDKILWVQIFTDLRTNAIDKFNEDMKKLEKRKLSFRANIDLPIKIFFNTRKFTSEEYFNKITTFDFERQIDFLYYFSPFVFSDNDEVFYDLAQGFINNNNNNLMALDKMVNYNQKLLQIIKKDPILRVFELQNLLKEDTKSYVYYNLGLCYAQIDDFHKAYMYFKKAFSLNPGNKLFAAMTLITAKRIDTKMRDNDYIINILKNNRGIYNYFGQNLYKFFIDPSFKIMAKNDDAKFKNTMYFKALDFLVKMPKEGLNKNAPLLKDYEKDPLVYLMRFSAKDKHENQFQYISRIQDKMPLNVNDNFLDGPLIVTKYYFDLLKAVGLFNKADLNIDGKSSPSYLRTKAYRDLHNKNPNSAVSILEYLQVNYKLEDKHTMYLLVAALLEAKRVNDASVTITLIKSMLDDPNADFLMGIQLLNELKTSSVSPYFKVPYTDSLIDFRLENFDELLESL